MCPVTPPPKEFPPFLRANIWEVGNRGNGGRESTVCLTFSAINVRVPYSVMFSNGPEKRLRGRTWKEPRIIQLRDTKEQRVSNGGGESGALRVHHGPVLPSPPLLFVLPECCTTLLSLVIPEKSEK